MGGSLQEQPQPCVVVTSRSGRLSTVGHNLEQRRAWAASRTARGPRATDRRVTVRAGWENLMNESRRMSPYQVLVFVAAVLVSAAGCDNPSSGGTGGAGGADGGVDAGVDGGNDGGNDGGDDGGDGGQKVIPSALGRYVTSGSADDAD